MIRLSPESEAQLDSLLRFYEERDRFEAARNLIDSVERVAGRLLRDPMDGLPAPRPYPRLGRFGLRWIKEGPYWIAHTASAGSQIIVAIFHEAADIPHRL